MTILDLPRRLEDGTPYLSPSQVREVLTCPARYQFKYIQGKREPITHDLLLGRLVHDALEEWARSGLGDATDQHQLPSNATLKGFVAGWLDAAQADIATAGTTVEALADEAVPLVVVAAESWVKALLYPVSLERRVVLPVRDWAVLGFVDAVCQDPHGRTVVLEWKTTKRAPSKGEASRIHAFQGLVYAAALNQEGLNVSKVVVAYIVKNKSPKVVMCSVDVTSEALRWARGLVLAADSVIRLGQFNPNPVGAGFICAPGVCGFWDECPGAAPFVTGVE